ncbi:MAG: MgtC/SapB family protein [Trueperaceae bacterium]|nr:MgtC/SapB family protein [Trueperaceae bacterium]
MNPTEAIYAFLVAVLLGFLIGLERERKREFSGSIFAGVRTFPLIALFGAACGVLSHNAGRWMMMVGLLSISSLLLLAYWRGSAGTKVGGTTEMAALVAFTMGILAGLGDYVAALAGAVLVTGILSLRDELRVLSGAVTRADLFALVQFAAVSLIILPIIPNENLGPWGVWNPRSIWLLVVLISGISFVGYILSKLISTDRSIGLSGFIGGIASSTAVTLSFSEQSRKNAELSQLFSGGVLAATAVSMVRLLILVGIIQPRLVLAALPGFGLYFLICALGGWLFFRRAKKEQVESAKLENPFELKTALSFALLFAFVLLMTRAAQEFLGEGGIFIASALSGLTQLDAITLTLAKQVGDGLAIAVAVKGLAVALMTNSLFKAGLTFSLGTARFARYVSLVVILAGLASLLLLWFMPVLGI